MSHGKTFSIGTEEAGVTQAVLRALEAGYRHIDTAWMYGNGEAERGVGEALRRWNGKREELFIVTKLANAHHKPADVAAALELSLKNLGLDYVDLYLMHCPVAYERIGKGENEWLTARFPTGKPKLDMLTPQRYDLTWKAMEKLVKNFAVLALPDLPKEDRIAIDEIRKEQGEVRFINYLSHWGFDIYNPGPEDPTEEP